MGNCYVISDYIYIYIFNSSITKLFFVPQGENEALESHNPHIFTKHSNNKLVAFSLAGRLMLLLNLLLTPDNDKHFIMRLFLFCFCFGSVLHFQQAFLH